MEKTTVESLIEMGFSASKAEEAVRATGSQGVQVAMDWILSNKEVSNPVDTRFSEPGVMQPKSLKCEDCGKLLRSELEAQAHAAKTNHQNFSESTEEIKPLSPEEKAAQLAKLEERMKEKRIAQEEKGKNDAKEREILRRKGGKELSEIRQKMELSEAKKMAEERKREKIEDRMARQRVKEEIARDRAEREARHCPPPKSQPLPPETTSTTGKKRDYDTCRLQIRLLDGSTAVKTFKATDNLQEVLIETGSQDCSLMMTFPRRIFTSEDSLKTLKELGLVPSAVLIQTLNKT